MSSLPAAQQGCRGTDRGRARLMCFAYRRKAVTAGSIAGVRRTWGAGGLESRIRGLATTRTRKRTYKAWLCRRQIWETGVDVWVREWAVDDCKGNEREAGYGGDELQGRNIDGKYRAGKADAADRRCCRFADEDYTDGEASDVLLSAKAKLVSSSSGWWSGWRVRKQCHHTYLCLSTPKPMAGRLAVTHCLAWRRHRQDFVGQCVAYQAHMSHEVSEYAWLVVAIWGTGRRRRLPWGRCA